ncbi:MAG TPA: hypothetical protein VGC00_05285 [Thermoanaerobaculia bacterium]
MRAVAAVALPSAGLALVRELMDEFALASGLTGGAPPRRYLWTDAYAVCNFLGLHRETGEGRYLDLALRLVVDVHHVLGRHRPDDARTGWLSGLAGEEAERHPTLGGLRIGKSLPERRPDEPYDPRREWDRDGQYFHYLTQWMHALARVGEETGQEVFRRWAVELARTAHARFVVRDASGRRGMLWKASVDLSRPLVASMGQHDPLDAWLAYLELEAGGTGARDAAVRAELARQLVEAASLCAGARWETDDVLGIGALLVAVFRLERLVARHGRRESELLERLLTAARISLEVFAAGELLAHPAESRLAFRELGLAIGLHAIERVAAPLALAVDELHAIRRHLPLAARGDAFWSDPAHRRSRTWTEHSDINAVMLATSLAPEGYLGPR